MDPTDVPSPELLRQLLRYEPETGKLFWRKRSADLFQNKKICNTWNSKFANAPAFTSKILGGYLIGSIHNKKYYAHRVIWAIQTGAWPKNHIDHKDGNRANNKFENIRDVTRGQNNSNKFSQKNSSSKYLGVSWRKRSKKWRVNVTKNGTTKYIGLFSDEIEAAKAYDHAAAQVHGEFAKLNFAK